jgi:arginine transport system permease protein
MQDYLMTLLGGLAITLQLTAFSLLLGVLMASSSARLFVVC